MFNATPVNWWLCPESEYNCGKCLGDCTTCVDKNNYFSEVLNNEQS